MKGWGADTPEIAAAVQEQWGGDPGTVDEPESNRRILAKTLAAAGLVVVAGVAAHAAWWLFWLGWRLV